MDERRLHVDEVMLRQDIGLSARLAELALKRAVLEGVTLIAFTGVLEANLKARLRFPGGPRLVLLPTSMDRAGWMKPAEVLHLYNKYYNYLEDSLLRIGIFVHSLRWASRSTFREALVLASNTGMPLGLHLSEGISEKSEFVARVSEAPRLPRIIAVHCIEDNPREMGIRCSSCPGSNMILYGRSRTSLEGVTSFGSDWPHLIGTVSRHIGLILRLFPARLGSVLYRITTGGYIDYGVQHNGDLVAYDSPLEDVITGRVLPRMVMVAGNIVVDESVIPDTGESLSDVEREVREVSKYASEVYGDGSPPLLPGPRFIWDIMESLGGEPNISLSGEVFVQHGLQ
ncbi:MAG: hypothetical protein F7C38_03335 [Desulfurococcales archaeon]|nr:hypothetical protein [Desulfurococcales archaeon]